MPITFFTKGQFVGRVTFLLALLCMASLHSSLAQENIPAKTNATFLKKNGKNLAGFMKKEKDRAWKMAKQKGWPTFQITQQGRIVNLVGVDDFGLPIYEATENETAAGTTRANKLYTGGGLGLNLSGSTIPHNKIAIWDGGSVLATHQEFATSRIIVKDGSATSSHGTHVAGTIAAAGIYSLAKGMAYGLPNLLSFDFDGDNAEMSTYAPDLLLSNHSYGVVAGWTQNSDQGNRWEFRGRWGENEDYKFGYYDSKAQAWDNICYNAPYYLPLKSAGNYRNDNGPAVGSTYYRYNASGTMVNAGTRPTGISSNDGYGIIGTYGTAKNILTVGAVNGLRYGASTPSDIVMSTFSAWGPTDDGRIKPDLVADGVNLVSTTNTGNANYATSSGTSMSAPNATGTLILLQELYKQRKGAFMRAATLKGLALATTSEAGSSPGPDYRFGWGLLNAENAAKAILDDGTKSMISERTLNQGETQTITIVASGNGPLVATICWTDPAITPVPTTNALNNTTLRLVNDLDTRMSDGTTTFYPWVLDPANPAMAATTGDNFRDNVEQIYIADAVPGKTYTFTVGHKNSLQSGAQAFSLIMTGIGGATYCISAPSSNADSKIINFSLANINHTPATTCTAYADYTAQTIELEKGKYYNLNLSMGTCGANYNKIAKVFIDWNGDGDFDDVDETVVTSGVINGEGTYSTSITVPVTAIADHFSLLRVVLVETALPNDVAACGTYPKGETQDYRVKILPASLNAQMLAILDPLVGACANAAQTVTVKVKNRGAQSMANLPITVTVKEGENVVTTLTGTYNGSLSPAAEGTVILPGSFNAEAGKTYTIIAKINLVGDLDSTDDEISNQVQIASAPLLSNTSSAYYCTSSSTYTLSSGGNGGTIFWYKTPTDTAPIAFGAATTTTVVPTTNQSYYAGLNDFTATIGPATKYHSDMGSGAGAYGQHPYNVYVTALAPMVIESARLYVGTSGMVTFYVKNSAGMVVSSSSISVTRTRSSDGTDNDTNDQGRIYTLNLIIPSAGDYTLSATYEGGATLFRSSGGGGNIPYPYKTAADIFAITGQSGSTSSPKSFYYFFYGMKVKAFGCVGATRLQVPLSKPEVTRNAEVLSSNFTSGNQWYLNGNPINGAENATQVLTQSGTYTVKVTLTGGCVVTSDPYIFDMTSLPVKLIEFSAKKINSGVALRWSTATEINNNRFEVERAGEDRLFVKLGSVAAKGAGNYLLLDKNPLIGNNYYRLNQIDNDDRSFSYGPYVIKFDLQDQLSPLHIYPNPAKGSFKVKMESATPESYYEIRLLNLWGQSVAIKKVLGIALTNGHKISITNLMGTYILEIRDVTAGKVVAWDKLISL